MHQKLLFAETKEMCMSAIEQLACRLSRSICNSFAANHLRYFINTFQLTQCFDAGKCVLRVCCFVHFKLAACCSSYLRQMTY